MFLYVVYVFSKFMNVRQISLKLAIQEIVLQSYNYFVKKNNTFINYVVEYTCASDTRYLLKMLYIALTCLLFLSGSQTSKYLERPSTLDDTLTLSEIKVVEQTSKSILNKILIY